jgi:hypothetical protein
MSKKSKKPAKVKSSFPSHLTVTVEDRGPDEWFCAHEDLDGIDDHGTEVAFYELVSTGKLKVTKEVV